MKLWWQRCGFGGPTDTYRCALDTNIPYEDGARCCDAASLPGNFVDCLNTCSAPPDCAQAFADPESLWPPSHQFVEIGIAGCIDPDGDPVSIVIEAIYQDEPTNANGIGDGNTCPDGTGVGTDTAEVRAERSGTGNGRVYEIHFSASDGLGSCSGSVTVCVPHNSSNSPCVDDLERYDSTQCGDDDDDDDTG